MQSVNHQFLEFSEQVKARYVKTVLQPLSGYRLNPRDGVNPNARIDFLLATPEENVEIIEYDKDGNGEPTQVRQVKFTYEDEVIELYTDNEVRSFERMNKLLIQNGLLVPYSESAPEIDKTNMISEAELHKIATLKTLNAFKVRVEKITSVTTLESLLKIMDSIDTITNAHMRFVKERIKELK